MIPATLESPVARPWNDFSRSPAGPSGRRSVGDEVQGERWTPPDKAKEAIRQTTGG